MDFSFSPQHQPLRATMRRHAEAEMQPHVAVADVSERFPKHLFRPWGEGTSDVQRNLISGAMRYRDLLP